MRGESWLPSLIQAVRHGSQVWVYSPVWHSSIFAVSVTSLPSPQLILLICEIGVIFENSSPALSIVGGPWQFFPSPSQAEQGKRDCRGRVARVLQSPEIASRQRTCLAGTSVPVPALYFTPILQPRLWDPLSSDCELAHLEGGPEDPGCPLVWN